jgi:formamidopyrimidine-DNA glycosylase
MPEIAEVEIVRQGVDRLVGERLERIRVVDDKLRSFPVAEVEGATLTGTMRHGKRLGLVFGDDVVCMHLRMTGSLLLAEDQRSRMTFYFASRPLSFIDPRRFGTVEMRSKEQFSDGLGGDLLRLDADSLADRLVERFGRSKVAAKSALLDQTIVAGVGNYVADEAFWIAKIDPRKEAREVNWKGWSALVAAAQSTARQALRAGGATFSDYQQVDGSSGQMQNLLSAYGRAGMPCLRCGSEMVKARVGGRGTSFCSTCQS